MAEIKNIILDFGKVLVDYDFYEFIHPIFDNDEDEQEFIDVVLSKEWNEKMDTEESSFNEIIDELIRLYPRFTKALEHFRDYYTEVVTGEVPGMCEVLKSLKTQGFKLYGLTNWCSKVYKTMEQFEIFRLLDGQIISSEEKVIKPDAEIYHRLFNRFNIKPEECIFTDDKEINIIGSRATGMDGIVFRNTSQFVEELRNRFGIIV